MVDTLPFGHLSSILHVLGHELHADLTDDFVRRDDARGFEARLHGPIEAARFYEAERGRACFPVETGGLKTTCGDCKLGVYTRRRVRRKRKPRTAFPTSSRAAITVGEGYTETVDHRTSPRSENVHFDVVKSRNVDLVFPSRPAMCAHPATRQKRRPRQPAGAQQADSATQTSPEAVKVKSKPAVGVQTAGDCPVPKPHLPPCYGSVELHSAAENAVRAVDKAIMALEKLALLAPKGSVSPSHVKSTSLMCVFLRQFHTELRSRHDRMTKLDVILRLWDELQKQQSMTKVKGQVNKKPSVCPVGAGKAKPAPAPPMDKTKNANTTNTCTWGIGKSQNPCLPPGETPTLRSPGFVSPQSPPKYHPSHERVCRRQW